MSDLPLNKNGAAERYAGYESMQIVHYPDLGLRTPGKEIQIVDDNIRLIANRMVSTMYNANGVGLAAPQVAQSIRLIIVDPWQDEEDPIVAINPVIQSYGGYYKGEEGCLSIPGFVGEVERAEAITVEYQNLEGAIVIEEHEGFPAVVFQHEIDHIDGILFTDRIGKMRRRVFIKEFGLERHPFTVPPSLADASEWNEDT